MLEECIYLSQFLLATLYNTPNGNNSPSLMFYKSDHNDKLSWPENCICRYRIAQMEIAQYHRSLRKFELVFLTKHQIYFVQLKVWERNMPDF